MPRRDVNLTVVLGDGPNADNSWDSGIAVASDTSDEYGMAIGKVASVDDDILGWTVRSQMSGDVAVLRTMLDGTINVKLGPADVAEPLTWVGDEMWLLTDGTGRMTKDGDSVETDQRSIALAVEAGKAEGGYCEVIVFCQKYVEYT